MDTAFAYLISAGMIGFGIWIVATAKVAGSDWFLVWIVIGLLPVAVGLMSLYGEIINDRIDPSGV